MTGYGRAESNIGDYNITIEIKSLNGKQFDVRMLTPSLLKAFEIDIRNLLNEELERGSIECSFIIKYNGATKPVSVNTDLLKAYYTSIKQAAIELNANDESLFSAIIRLPEVVSNNNNILNSDDWDKLKKLIQEATNSVNKHRLNEGAALEVSLIKNLETIENLDNQLKLLEPNRRIKIKENLQKIISENISAENIDNNRLEQELIYYLEKIDISEEQVRLNNHINYFKEILKGKEKNKGKKLGFVLQEFGREINTTGSKAYDSDIQKIVVLMKDELEKMKEQVLNIL